MRSHTHRQHALRWGWGVTCALAWCAWSAGAYAKAPATSAKKARADEAERHPAHVLLRRRADEALARGRFTEAATLLRSAFARSDDPQDLRREQLAWLRADDCDHAEQAALLYQHQKQATRTGRHNADRVLVECGFRRADAALSARDPERALTTLSHIMLRMDTAQEHQRFDALARAAIQARHPTTAQDDAHAAPAQTHVAHPLERAGETIGGIAATLTAAITVVNVVAAPSGDPIVDEAMADARVQLRYGDVRRRASAGHWIIPTITTLWSLVGVRGLVLSEDGQGLLHELEGFRLPLRLPPLPMQIDEARIVPQWQSNTLGARLRFRF